MATPTPKSAQKSSERPRPEAAGRTMPDVVNPGWLLKALGLTFVAAMICAYLALCLLVHQGGWQLMLHPVAKVTETPSVPFQPVRFDAAGSGTPRLAAWWVPAASGNPSAPTLLLLHGGDGNLSQSAAQVSLLHQLDVNVFAFDYGGYGESDPPHPTQERMTADAEAALDYLTNTRHLAPARIVPFGVGLGASLAATLAEDHPELPMVIVQNAEPEAPLRVARNSKANLLPMRLLVKESFDVEAHLRAARQPRLLLVGGRPAPTAEQEATAQQFFKEVQEPKMSVTLKAGPSADRDYVEAIRRFLDEYLPGAKP